MTREEAAIWLREHIDVTPDGTKQSEAVELAIEALEQQPCEDCISRAEALRHSHIEYDNDGEGYRVVYFEDIENLQSVTPGQIKGRWLKVFDDTGRTRKYHFRCSICGNDSSGWGEYNYCPICGAEMKEV